MVIDVNIRLFTNILWNTHLKKPWNVFRSAENQKVYGALLLSPMGGWQLPLKPLAAMNSRRALHALCSYCSLLSHLLQEGLTLENCVRRKKKIFSAPVASFQKIFSTYVWYNFLYPWSTFIPTYYNWHLTSWCWCIDFGKNDIFRDWLPSFLVSNFSIS